MGALQSREKGIVYLCKSTNPGNGKTYVGSVVCSGKSYKETIVNEYTTKANRSRQWHIDAIQDPDNFEIFVLIKPTFNHEKYRDTYINMYLSGDKYYSYNRGSTIGDIYKEDQLPKAMKNKVDLIFWTQNKRLKYFHPKRGSPNGRYLGTYRQVFYEWFLPITDLRAIPVRRSVTIYLQFTETTDVINNISESLMVDRFGFHTILLWWSSSRVCLSYMMIWPTLICL